MSSFAELKVDEHVGNAVTVLLVFLRASQGFEGTREHSHLPLGNKEYFKITFREQGNCLGIFGNKGTLTFDHFLTFEQISFTVFPVKP